MVDDWRGQGRTHVLARQRYLARCRIVPSPRRCALLVVVAVAVFSQQCAGSHERLPACGAPGAFHGDPSRGGSINRAARGFGLGNLGLWSCRGDAAATHAARMGPHRSSRLERGPHAALSLRGGADGPSNDQRPVGQVDPAQLPDRPPPDPASCLAGCRAQPGPKHPRPGAQLTATAAATRRWCSARTRRTGTATGCSTSSGAWPRRPPWRRACSPRSAPRSGAIRGWQAWCACTAASEDTWGAPPGPNPAAITRGARGEGGQRERGWAA
jgi:hypothetical protein